MDSFALRQRPLQERFAGVAGALLLQGGFLFLFLYSMPQITRPIEAAREMIFVLHRPPPPAPVLPEPRALPSPGVSPLPESPPVISIPALGAPPAALPDLRGFGQALNDCAPEKYGSLTPELKARCPKPGAGVAIQELPKFFGSVPAGQG